VAGLLADPSAQPADSPADIASTGRALTSADLEQVRRTLHEAMQAGPLTNAVLDDWELTVNEHGRATRDRPAGVLLDDLVSDLSELQHAMAGCHSASALRRLARVTAQMAGLMCLTLIKLDDRAAFRRWARTARIAAEETGDPLTKSWVRAQEAYGYYYSGDLAGAIAVAQDAQDLSRRTPTVGGSLAAALEARAQAAVGERRRTFEALNRAESILSNLPPDAVTASAFGYSESQLRFHEGNALTHLRETEAAWTAQQRALELVPPGDYMDRALTQLDRASCLAHEGDGSAAMAQAMEALLPLSDVQREGIITLRAQATIVALPPQERVLPVARELRELLSSTAETKEIED
jgi:tetratricopeptide (TPR) repeat protein